MDIGVLIVDDHEDVRILLRRIIERSGTGLFVTGEAASGREAIELVDELDPAVIVLDDKMPDMDGVQTALLIRQRRPKQPIVLFTAFVDDVVRRRAQAAGIGIAIPKSELRSVPAAIREAALDASED